MKFSYSLLFTLVFLLSSWTLAAQAIQGTYAIKNVKTGMLLRPEEANKKDGTPIVAYTPTNWKCMTWDFNQVEGKSYSLKNLFTGKTFQPKELQVREGVLLEQQPIVDGKAEQTWEFLPIDKNTFYIKLKGTDLYITPVESNNQIKLSKKKSGDIQHWTIYEQHPVY